MTSVFPGPTDTPLFTGDVDRSQLIQPETVARAIVDAITTTGDTQLTEIHVRPRRSFPGKSCHLDPNTTRWSDVRHQHPRLN